MPLVHAVPAVRGKRGRPRQRPDVLYADRGYDYDTYRRDLRDLGIRPVIARRGTEHGSGLGVHRWVVEAGLRTPALVPPLAHPLGDPRRPPRSLPHSRLQHHLLAPPENLILLGALILQPHLENVASAFVVGAAGSGLAASSEA
jgi:hypothetical protein